MNRLLITSLFSFDRHEAVVRPVTRRTLHGAGGLALPGLMLMGSMMFGSVGEAQEDSGAAVEVAPADEAESAAAEAIGETASSEPEVAGPSMTEDERLSYALGWIFARQSEDMLQVPLDSTAFMDGFRQGSTAPDSAAMSRAYGVLVGNDMKDDAEGLDLEVLEMALSDRLAGSEPQLSDEEIQMAMFGFQQRVEEREARAAAMETEDYLLNVAAEEGVVTLDSGLLVRMIELGEGGADAPRPSVGDDVRLNYELRDVNGEVIESTFEAEPVVFPITDGLIAGFREGVTQMPLGSTYEFVVPPALGYGAGGPRPNGVLIFKVQALEIVSSAPADATPEAGE